MILRDGGPQLEKAAQTLGGGSDRHTIGPSGNGRENTWLVARHEDCPVGPDDERRRRAVAQTTGGDVHGVTDSGHETRPLPSLYIVIGTVSSKQKTVRKKPETLKTNQKLPMHRVHEPRLAADRPRGQAKVDRLLGARAPEARAVGPVVLRLGREPGAVVRRVEGPVC